MSNVRTLHDKAMKLAQLAQVASHKGDCKQASELARQAYGYEAQAADLVPVDKSSEPTRSILYRSAASLAYQSQNFYAAQRLISRGLAGFPPPQIERELKELERQVNLLSHQKEHERKVEKEEPQPSLLAFAVGT